MGWAAEVITEARSRAGLGLRELARLAGTSHATLHRYERGDVDPTGATLERIVAACGYDLRVTLVPTDRADEHLEDAFAALTPADRLETIARWAQLRGRAGTVEA